MHIQIPAEFCATYHSCPRYNIAKSQIVVPSVVN